MKNDLMYSWDKTFGDLNKMFSTSMALKEEEYDSETKTLMVDMPGIKKEDINISVDKKILTAEGKTGRRHYRNSYTIKYPFNEEAITAKLVDGVLYITIPEGNEKVGKKIAID